MRLNARGFSLIELMVALAISSIISLALSVLFVTTVKVKAENDRFGQQIENGRFSLEVLTQEIRNTGYWGGLNMGSVRAHYQVLAGRAVPDPCATSDAALSAALPVHIQGYDNGDGGLTCINDVKPNTDVMVIRRAGTCAVGSTGCEASAITNVPYFQASFCSPGNGTELAKVLNTTGVPSTDTSWADLQDNWYKVSATVADLNLHKMLPGDLVNCNVASNIAPLRPYIVNIFFISNNSSGADGIPALKMVQLGAGGFSAPQTLASGIEQMQLEYGIDADGDGTPESFTPAPGNACGSDAACRVDSWLNVMSVRIHILSANTSASPEYTDSNTYVLGLKVDGTANSYTPANRNYRRHYYNAQVKLSNIRG